MAKDVKQRMIERMVELLATKGLQGASFSEVLEGSGAPRGSLYHHFPGGKDQLVVAALDCAAARSYAHLERLKGTPAPEAARAFIDSWRATLKLAKLNIGCALVAVSVAAETPELRAHAGAIFREWRSRVSDVLAAGGVAPDRAPGLAAALLAACEGAVVMARAEHALDPFDLVAAEQVAVIAAATKLRRKRPAMGAAAG